MRRQKPIAFLGNSLSAIRDFPVGVQKEAGVQLHKVQLGLEPSDWKPMPSIGAGVSEIRIRESGDAFRIIYLARLSDRVVVLHAFQKKTQRTSKPDLDLASQRLALFMRTYQ